MVGWCFRFAKRKRIAYRSSTTNVGTVEPPSLLQFEDCFADADGNPVDSAPVGRARVELAANDGGTRMTSTTVYATAEDLQKVLDMGVVEGTRQSVAQIDQLLAA